MKERPITVLIAAAAPEDRASMRDALARDSADRYVVIEAESGFRALELRRARKPDCLILDHDLPDLSALEALKKIAAEEGTTACAVVVLVGSGDTRLAVEAMESGAHCWLEKNRAGGEELLRAVSDAIEKAERRWASEHERMTVGAARLAAKAAAGSAAGSRPERADSMRAEEQLRLLKTAIEQSNEPVMIMTAQFDPAGPRIVYVNSAFTKMTGYAREEVIGKTPRILDGPKTDRAVLDRLRKDCAAGKVFYGETIKYRKDGSEFHLEWTAGPMRNERGEVTHIVATQRDVTERRRIEEALRRSEVEFRSLFELSAIGMAQCSRDFKYFRVNRKFCQMLGYSEQELLRLTFLDITHPDDREVSAVQVSAGFAGELAGSYLEKRYVRKDGEIIWALVNWAIIPDAEGRPLHTVASVQDITARKQAEEALRESEAKHASEAKTMRDLYDSSARLQSAPDLHVALDEILQSSIRLMRADFGNVQLYDAERQVLRLAALHGFDEPFVETFRVVGADDDTACGRALRGGTRAVIEDVERDELYAPYRKAAAAAGYRGVQSTPLYDRDGSLLGVLSTHWRAPHQPSEQDLLTLDLYARQAINFIIRARAEEASRESERRTQEHAAELADLHRRKDEFLAMLSHELRNPLSPILNAAHILRLQKDENPLQQQARAVIERQVDQLSRLVNDLLEVSRVITGTIRLRPERLDVRGVVEQALESARPLIDQRRHQLFASLPAEPIWLEGDVARLEQVVVNLLNNAAKYTNEGGKIWVDLRPEGDEVALRVRDTGVGISPELLPRVFDLFTQADRTPDRSQGGLGIGLSLTQRLVELHRGKIEAHSAGLGQGSEFIVRLPVLPPSEMGTDTTSTGTAKQAARDWRVLVVDDNVDAANMIAMTLQLFGHQTETVYSAQSALETAVECRPDFVVLDIGLPGMDGYEVARRLRQIPELKDTRLIAATGYGQDADRQRSEEAGFDYHLVKPIDPEKLQTVLEMLGRQTDSAKRGGRIQE
jgi:PAS domain S-box-containing protein